MEAIATQTTFDELTAAMSVCLHVFLFQITRESLARGVNWGNFHFWDSSSTRVSQWAHELTELLSLFD